MYTAGRINEKIDTLITWKDSVDKRIEHMDDTGTKAGVARNQVDDLRNIEQDRRLNNVETTLSTIVPAVSKMETKIDIVANLLEKQSAKR